MNNARSCVVCGSSNTVISQGRQEWHRHTDGGFIYASCFGKEYRKTHDQKPYLRAYGKRRLRFKGQRVILAEPVRTGICSKCRRSVAKGEIKRTHMHHEKYDDTNPAANTVELCVACHRYQHGNQTGPHRSGYESVRDNRRTEEIIAYLERGLTPKDLMGMGYSTAGYAIARRLGRSWEKYRR